MKALSLLIALAAPLSAAPALSYADLLKAAKSSDQDVERLSIGEERARIALELALLARDRCSFSAGTGDMAASLKGSGAALAASPGASCALPGGSRLELELPFETSPSASSAKPRVSASIPIARGPDGASLAAEKARVLYEDARRQLSRAELELEGRLVAALKAALEARAAVSRAGREEAKARRELDRAVSVDGASPGGAAYMSLERALRIAARDSRDALAAEAEKLRALRVLAGPSAPEGGSIVPEDFPEPDMSVSLPAPSECLEAVRAREKAALERLEAAASERRTTLSAELGAAYGLGGAGRGPDLSAGLRAAFGESGVELAAGAGWSASGGPCATLALSWDGAPGRERGLRASDSRLAEASRALEVASAERSSREGLAGLEERRRALDRSARDAAEDLAAAEEQLSAFSAWRERGLVGDADYAEALAARDECRSRSGMAVLDRMAWRIDAELIAVPDIGGMR